MWDIFKFYVNPNLFHRWIDCLIKNLINTIFCFFVLTFFINQ